MSSTASGRRSHAGSTRIRSRLRRAYGISQGHRAADSAPRRHRRSAALGAWQRGRRLREARDARRRAERGGRRARRDVQQREPDAHAAPGGGEERTEPLEEHKPAVRVIRVQDGDGELTMAEAEATERENIEETDGNGSNGGGAGRTAVR